MILKYVVTVDQTAVASEDDSPITTYRGMVDGNDMADCVKHLTDYYQGPYEPIMELRLIRPSSTADEENHIVESSSEDYQDGWRND